MTEQIDDPDEIDIELDSSEESEPSPFDEPIPESPLGHLVAHGTGLKIGRNEDSMFAVIQPSEFGRVEVGDYVRIPYYRPDLDETNVERQLICSVQSLEHETALDDRQFTSADSYGAEQYRFVAELSPISEITLNDEQEFQGNFVSKPPRPTVKMDKVKENEFLRCGLDVPSNGIYVGDISVNGVRVPSQEDPLEYYLFNPNATDETTEQGEPTVFRHMLVAGSTGTGKTHTSKNIIRQYAKCKQYKIDVPAEEKDDVGVNQRERGLNITIIDPEDEYTELGEDSNDMDRAKELAEKRGGLEYGAIGDDTEFEIFAPQTRDSSTKDLDTGTNEVTDFGIPFSIVQNHHELMMPNDPQGPTAQVIHKILRDYFKQNDKPYEYSDFESWFEDIEQERLMDKDKYADTMVNAAARRVTGREEYSSVFDVGSNKFSDQDMIDRMFSANKTSVITTGHLRGASQNLVVQAISSYVIQNKITSDPESTRIKGTPMVLGLDEAHEYLQEPETTRERFIVSRFRRAARRGRKDKFGLYFITQNPSDIDGEIRDQINSKIYMQLDSKVVNDPNVFVPKEYERQLPEFDKGQMIVDQPNVDTVEITGLDTCLTRHSK